MTNTAQNPSQFAANIKLVSVSLHNPTESTAAVYQFDTVENAQAFKNQHCLSAYRIAHFELFAVENVGAFA